MEKTVITFNDLPEIVAQLRDEVMSLRSLLTEQRSVNNARAVDTHVPMSVEEAAEYLGILHRMTSPVTWRKSNAEVTNVRRPLKADLVSGVLTGMSWLRNKGLIP